LENKTKARCQLGNKAMEIKPHLKPRGTVAKEEDPKPSQQQYKLQIKST